MPASRALVDALELQPPRACDPGYSKTVDGFLAVNAGLIIDGIDCEKDRLRLLISFEPHDVQAVAKERTQREFPDYDSLSSEGRRALWARVLQIGKQARTERVVEIVRELGQVDVPPESIVVHRVSNTFFASMTLPNVRKLLALRNAGFGELRRVTIQKAATL